MPSPHTYEQLKSSMLPRACEGNTLWVLPDLARAIQHLSDGNKSVLPPMLPAQFLKAPRFNLISNVFYYLTITTNNMFFIIGAESHVCPPHIFSPAPTPGLWHHKTLYCSQLWRHKTLYRLLLCHNILYCRILKLIMAVHSIHSPSSMSKCSIRT